MIVVINVINVIPISAMETSIQRIDYIACTVLERIAYIHQIHREYVIRVPIMSTSIAATAFFHMVKFTSN